MSQDIRDDHRVTYFVELKDDYIVDRCFRPSRRMLNPASEQRPQSFG